MARTTLFRGKTIAENKWVYGGFHEMNGRCFIIANTNIIECQYYVYEVYPETIGQFTGWHDRHHKYIFENDVVEFTSCSTSHKYLIWWQHEGNMLTAVPLDGMAFNGTDYHNYNYPNFDYSTFCLMMLDPYGDFSDIRVIGNIRDNPNLLSEVKIYED